VGLSEYYSGIRQNKLKILNVRMTMNDMQSKALSLKRHTGVKGERGYSFYSFLPLH
jgi:hypothetical protein